VKRGNRKLGRFIWQWSLPAGLGHICIGATVACLAICYAMQSHYNHKTVKTSLANNYKLSLTDFFVGFILGCLLLFKIRTVRIHAAGDFYSPEYVEKWTEIATRRPDVTFYAYTRSWRNRDGSINDSMVQAFSKFAALPNARLWYSCDKNTGEPPSTSHVMRCYLQGSDDDIPDYSVDLFFRNKRKSVVKQVRSTIVCPVENGTTKTTCSACKLCYTPALLHRVNAKIVRSNSENSVSGNANSAFKTSHELKQNFKQKVAKNAKRNCNSKSKQKSKHSRSKPKSVKAERKSLHA